MELTRKKPKSHTVEKSRDQVLANKKALKSDQRSKPEANIPMTKDPRSGRITEKSRDKVKATKIAILGDQRSSPKANTLETKEEKSNPEVLRTHSRTNRSREKVILKSEIFREMTEKVKQGNSANNVKDIFEKIKTEKKNSEEDLANPKVTTEMVKQGDSA